MDSDLRALVSLEFLNEVLSLNAQESGIADSNPTDSCILNEVLSLNAQELATGI